MTLSISEIDAVASTVPDVTGTQPGDTAPDPNPVPRPPTLVDLLAEADAHEPDPTAAAQQELAEIIGRADRPQPGDGKRLLALTGTLGIDRRTLRAAVETVAAWNGQRSKAQAEVASAETRLAVLVGEISDLEAKRQALELPDGYAALHALAVGFIAHALKNRAPGLLGGFLAYCGWKSDVHGFDKGNHRCMPVMSAARKEWVELLRGETARQIIAGLARRNVQRGGVASGCNIDQLAESDL